MSPSDWSVIMDALRILSPLLGGWAVYLLRQVVTELRAMGTKLVSVEAWQTNHDRLDNERFQNLQRQVDGIDAQRERLGLGRALKN